MTEKKEYEEVTVQVPVSCERAFILLGITTKILKDAGYYRFANDISEIRREIAGVHIPSSKRNELTRQEQEMIDAMEGTEEDG